MSEALEETIDPLEKEETAAESIIEPVKSDKSLAVLNLNGTIKIVTAPTLKDLKKKLKEYPATALEQVWRGKKLALKHEVQVTF